MFFLTSNLFFIKSIKSEIFLVDISDGDPPPKYILSIGLINSLDLK